MNLITLLRKPDSGTWKRAAIAAWTVALLLISIRVVIWPHLHTVYPVFAAAARNWSAGVPSYEPVKGLDVYRYGPPATVLFIPFSTLPGRSAAVTWRLFSAAVYLSALFWWSRAMLPLELTLRERSQFFLLLLPLSLGNINNGQSNVLLVGLLLSGVAAALVERWNVAAGCLAAASFFKVYPLAVGLLLVLSFPRRLAIRLAAAFGIVAAFPFLTQARGYVASQYYEWASRLLTEPRYGRMEPLYSDIRLLFRAWFTPLTPGAYLLLQVSSAVGIALVCRFARRDARPERMALSVMLGLACCWMTVFGLSAESATYIFLAPIVGGALIESRMRHHAFWVQGILWCSYGLLVLREASGVSANLGRRVGALAPQPIAGLLLFAALLAIGFQTGRGPLSREN